MLRCGEYVFLRRDWRTDASRLTHDLSTIASTATPYWVVLFPEGSRRTAAKVAAAQAYARSQGLPVLSHLLFPRFKAFVAAIQAARAARAAATAAPVFEAVVDATFVFDPPTPPTVWQCLTGRAASTIHMHVTYHPLASLPGGDGSAAAADATTTATAATAAAATGTANGTRRGSGGGAGGAGSGPAPGATAAPGGAAPIAHLGSDGALERWLTDRWVAKDALLAEYAAAADMRALHPVPPLGSDAPAGAFPTFPPCAPRTRALRAAFFAVSVGGLAALRAAAARPALLRALLLGGGGAAAVLVASFALILRTAPVKRAKAR